MIERTIKPTLRLWKVGDTYRPIVKINSVNQNIPTEITVSGRKYILDSVKKKKSKLIQSEMEKDIIISLLQRVGKCPKRPHEMKLSDLRKILIDLILK